MVGQSIKIYNSSGHLMYMTEIIIILGVLKKFHKLERGHRHPRPSPNFVPTRERMGATQFFYKILNFKEVLIINILN